MQFTRLPAVQLIAIRGRAARCGHMKCNGGNTANHNKWTRVGRNAPVPNERSRSGMRLCGRWALVWGGGVAVVNSFLCTKWSRSTREVRITLQLSRDEVGVRETGREAKEGDCGRMRANRARSAELPESPERVLEAREQLNEKEIRNTLSTSI